MSSGTRGRDEGPGNRPLSRSGARILDVGISTKVIELDGSGAGSVRVTPCYFVGALGCTTVSNDGDNLGTAFLTQGTARFAVGEVDVSGGSPSGEAVLYFDID